MQSQNTQPKKSPSKRVTFRLPLGENETTKDNNTTTTENNTHSTNSNVNTLLGPMLKPEHSTSKILQQTKNETVSDFSLSSYKPNNTKKSKQISRDSLSTRYKYSKRRNSRRNRALNNRRYLSSDPEFDYDRKNELKIEQLMKCQAMFDILKKKDHLQIFEQFLDIDLEKQSEIFSHWKKKESNLRKKERKKKRRKQENEKERERKDKEKEKQKENEKEKEKDHEKEKDQEKKKQVEQEKESEIKKKNIELNN
ncbi:chascon isoform d-related [Anaeramoeba flamelloides]|uniref:Chascon isoform d-related n=1 Tax=Anaeramoeba flamelloides TaxID=1746091 RepID=A0AAV7Z7J9_9EUKA|nr:chascon isoform d-related [Anaeramoeba flamelloides]